MRHGIDGYFHEVDQTHRRVTRIGVLVLCAFMIAEFAAREPVVVETLNDPRRFGFEGPEQIVERILLEQTGPEEHGGANVRTVVGIAARRGGGDQVPSPRKEGMRPSPEKLGRGSGVDDMDLQAQMRAMALEGPVMRSEDLIVERLVRPDYPEEAQRLGIEGRVDLLGLVDTTGDIIEVHVVSRDHPVSLEAPAMQAALQSRYRPYRGAEGAQRAWAMIRYDFKIVTHP